MFPSTRLDEGLSGTLVVAIQRDEEPSEAVSKWRKLDWSYGARGHVESHDTRWNTARTGMGATSSFGLWVQQ